MNRTQLITVAIAMLLSACKSANSASDFYSGSAQTPAQELIEQLEEEGKLPKLDRTTTLEGIDANHNNIRDDIEAHIKAKYPAPELQKPVMQIAAAFQEALTSDHSDRELQLSITNRMSRAKQCFYYRIERNPQLGEPYKIGTGRNIRGETFIRYEYPSSELKKMISNTKPRLKAYLKHNAALDGMAFRLLEGDTCDD